MERTGNGTNPYVANISQGNGLRIQAATFMVLLLVHRTIYVE
jgi:hypothetical protein